MRILLLLVVVSMVILSGCIRQENVLTDEEKIAVNKYSGPMLDNMMRGFNDENYTRFSQNFGSILNNFFGKTQFEQLINETKPGLGLYVSRSTVDLEKNNGLYILTYNTDWEKKDGVKVSLTYRVDDPFHSIQSFDISKE